MESRLGYITFGIVVMMVFDDNKIPEETLVRLILTHVLRLLDDIYPNRERNRALVV